MQGTQSQRWETEANKEETTGTAVKARGKTGLQGENDPELVAHLYQFE
jgi:hypothetical protein